MEINNDDKFKECITFIFQLRNNQLPWRAANESLKGVLAESHAAVIDEKYTAILFAQKSQGYSLSLTSSPENKQWIVQQIVMDTTTVCKNDRVSREGVNLFVCFF